MFCTFHRKSELITDAQIEWIIRIPRTNCTIKSYFCIEQMAILQHESLSKWPTDLEAPSFGLQTTDTSTKFQFSKERCRFTRKIQLHDSIYRDMRYALPWTILLVMIYSIRISPTRRRFTHIIKNHINAEADSQEEQSVKMSAIDSFDTGPTGATYLPESIHWLYLSNDGCWASCASIVANWVINETQKRSIFFIIQDKSDGKITCQIFTKIYIHPVTAKFSINFLTPTCSWTTKAASPSISFRTTS